MTFDPLGTLEIAYTAAISQRDLYRQRYERLRAELQAAQERERVLDGALMLACIWLAGDEIGIDRAQAYYDEALAVQRTEEPSDD